MYPHKYKYNLIFPSTVIQSPLCLVHHHHLLHFIYAASFTFMAYLTTIIMYNHHNSDHPKSTFNPPISPRISFSNDFAESIHSRKPTRDYHTPPVSSDFEFSVSNNNMMTADELFFKGRLLPFKDVASGSVKTTTLRDELLAGEDDDTAAGVSLRPPKASSTRWKGFLGLRKSHIGSKRSDKSDGSRSGQEPVHASKTSQEMVNEGGGSSSCRDIEFRMQ
ncbi:hypothetical protein QVD17_09960 [Tagetes erecta]|uniref:Transmembrane protein n=1 Tax=Tagetes erecta TaxID=13708 RepID=A0AAD8P5I3_TARER|nr:hypothetical protein QVD17_09960 [Tagetes erecta]